MRDQEVSSHSRKKASIFIPLCLRKPLYSYKSHRKGPKKLIETKSLKAPPTLFFAIVTKNASSWSIYPWVQIILKLLKYKVQKCRNKYSKCRKMLTKCRKMLTKCRKCRFKLQEIFNKKTGKLVQMQFMSLGRLKFRILSAIFSCN